MSKKWFYPILFSQDTPGDDIVIGGGTGQTTTDPYPCSYDDWLVLFSDDYDYDGDDTAGTRNDYRTWWEWMMEDYPDKFNEDNWKEFNP